MQGTGNGIAVCMVASLIPAAHLPARADEASRMILIGLWGVVTTARGSLNANALVEESPVAFKSGVYKNARTRARGVSFLA